jgi:tRNA(Leu) C34 or U34 (ribose-2'-O)-methylase TrmL
MKINAPIILNCFSRGGSNILWNIFISHPDVCSPIQETLEIFRLDWRDLRYEGLQAAWLTRQPRFFDQWNLRDRQPVSRQAQEFIDETLFHWKSKTFRDAEMQYKSETESYSLDEVERARLALKNNNGTIFLSERFVEMYPGVTFFGLVRDPVPLYESHRRHKTPVSVSPEKFAAFYICMAEKMLADAERWDFYHILRFEDVLRDPVSILQKACACAGLDISRISKLRFKAKPHMQADGTHGTHFHPGRHYWFELDEISQILEADVNRFQATQLEPEIAETINMLTREICASLGYQSNVR